MRNAMLSMALTVALAATMGCGASPVAGPSPVLEVAPAVTVASQATTTRALPAGLDPVYVHTVGPKRWDGGPFHHCIAPEVDRAVVEPIIAEMTALSGIPRTEDGPCNVSWLADYGRAAHTYSELLGWPDRVISAKVFLYARDAQSARHEAGHVLGLDHSPHRDDLMYATPAVENFSRDELAILAWIYGR